MSCHGKYRSSWSLKCCNAIPSIFSKLSILTGSISLFNLLIFAHTGKLFFIFDFLYHLVYFIQHLGCIWTIQAVYASYIPSSAILFHRQVLFSRPTYKFILCYFYIDIMIFLLNYWAFSSPHFDISTQLSICLSQINDLLLEIFPLSLIYFCGRSITFIRIKIKTLIMLLLQSIIILIHHLLPNPGQIQLMLINILGQLLLQFLNLFPYFLILRS